MCAKGIEMRVVRFWTDIDSARPEHRAGQHEDGCAVLECRDCHDAGYHVGWDQQDPWCPLCLCEEEGHAFAPEDIADGVVGGGAAHVWRIYCARCGAEGEPDDLSG